MPLIALFRPFVPIVLLSGLAGSVAGAATVALLAKINATLNGQGEPSVALFLTFVGLCAISLVGSATSDIATNFVGQAIVAKVRASLGRQILHAPLEELERYRLHRLIPVLTNDVDSISDIAFLLASLVIASTIVAGCLVYLAWLSLPMFGLLAAMLICGVVLQYIARERGIAGFLASRDAEDRLHKAYRAITEGAKELRMNRGRRERLFTDRILGVINEIKTTNTRSIVIFVLATTLGSSLYFLAIALSFGFASWSQSVTREVLSGFVLVLLFMKGPVDQILEALPSIVKAQVAFRRVAALLKQFGSSEIGKAAPTDAKRARVSLASGIELRSVSYSFPSEPRIEPFRLGPIDLTIRAGEILFIVGDNGSGKTTLIKVLLGLYGPRSGTVLVDGEPVTDATRDDYRQLFSTVFSDYYLFEDVPGDRSVSAQEVASYLERLEIAHKVRVEDGVLTTTDLSTGQRKRLALLHAYLEHRPIIVFDEWAADQDPAFRRIFYLEILPELKRQRRTLIVISHDDRFFTVADRIVRLREGKLVESEANFKYTSDADKMEVGQPRAIQPPLGGQRPGANS